MRAENFIANFDSASAMLAANGSYLKGKSFSMVGMLNAEAMRPLGPTLNALPKWIREVLYILGGWSEGISPRRTHQVRSEEIARWTVSQHPRRPYQAAMIGSSNGALVHLCAALGIPWLPQTVLIPVQHRHFEPDEPAQDLEWGREPGRRLLDANPDLQLHHMHDPNQDRLMIQRMSYFRVKRRRLGGTIEQFLTETLPRGATLFVVNCRLKWPTVRVDDRYYFQCGAYGGATPEEYLHGSPRVSEYLARYDFGTFSRYYMDFKKIPARYPLPGPVSLDLLDRFLEEQGDRYAVRITAGAERAAAFPGSRLPDRGISRGKAVIREVRN